MAKCYYCSGTDKFCSECKRAAAAKATPPSPNEVKPPVAEKKTTETSKPVTKYRTGRDIVQELIDKAKDKPKEKLYGWVSQQALRIQRGVIYKRPDGSEVLVTCVGHDPNHHGTGWKDIQCIGEVTDYVRQG